jgi:hypothetical protein
VNSSCIPSSVLAAAFLLVDGVAMPHDQSSSGSLLREQNAASRNVHGPKHNPRTQPGRGAP